MLDILAMLIAERDKLDCAIAAIQGTSRRRGRPPKMAGGGGDIATPFKRKRGGMSAAARKAQSRRMKAYWVKRRKQKA